jgi:hypothetical protein
VARLTGLCVTNSSFAACVPAQLPKARQGDERDGGLPATAAAETGDVDLGKIPRNGTISEQI